MGLNLYKLEWDNFFDNFPTEYNGYTISLSDKKDGVKTGYLDFTIEMYMDSKDNAYWGNDKTFEQVLHSTILSRIHSNITFNRNVQLIKHLNKDCFQPIIIIQYSYLED